MNNKVIINALSCINESTVRKQEYYHRNGMDFVFRANGFYQEIINLTKKSIRFYRVGRRTPYRGKLLNGTVIWSK